jgi:uncharacterized repeat protein (TIGR03837 family)
MALLPVTRWARLDYSCSRMKHIVTPIMRAAERWDIFCRVVDNFGDAAVCWRLARELAHEHGGQVRLWIDDLESLIRLEPQAVFVEQQMLLGIEVNHWGVDLPANVVPADFVVDAFGCGLPDPYVRAMAQCARSPTWIVLEYLTAESWVPHYHALPSPHPRLPLVRYFFFPGFVEGTGGLLREEDLFVRRDAFGAHQRETFWRSIGHAPPLPGATTVSLFGYESAPLAELLRCWENGPQNVVVVIPQAPLTAVALNHFGAGVIPRDRILRRGALEARFVPFVAQTHYDELLWSCDCNFVRGEDSFVRAQWAARPFIWHAYPQPEDAHSQKLDAFLDLYVGALPAGARSAVGDMMRFWNQSGGSAVSPRRVWDAFVAQRDELLRHNRAWADRIAGIGSLAANLASFCRDKLK